MAGESLEIEPARLLLTSEGRARVRIRGRGRGLLSAGGVRRWVWGDFDESVVLRLSPGRSSVLVELRTLGGRERRELPVSIAVDLRPPEAARPRRLGVGRLSVGRSARLRVERFRLPRVVRLERTSIEFDSTELDGER